MSQVVAHAIAKITQITVYKTTAACSAIFTCQYNLIMIRIIPALPSIILTRQLTYTSFGIAIASNTSAEKPISIVIGLYTHAISNAVNWLLT